MTEYERCSAELLQRGHTITDLDDLLDCCQIIAKLGDGIEVRPTVSPDERAS